MASTYSSLKFELIGTGEQDGTWGDTTNTNLGTAIEQAITGSGSVSFSSADVTLTLANSNTAQTARNLRLVLVGTSDGARQLIVPAIEKQYIVKNELADAVTIKNSTGTGVTIPSGKTMVVFNDATNVVDTTTYATGLTIGGALAVTGNVSVTGATNLANTVASNLTIGSLGGILKGTAGVVSAATAGTDYVAPGTATTFTTLQTFSGTANNAALTTNNILETATVSSTAATGAIDYDLTTQSVLYYTLAASGNWVLNFRGSSSASLNSIMSTGQSISATFLVTQGATAYYSASVNVDGVSVTPKWQGGVAPTAGNANSVDMYTYAIVKTGGGAFTVFASQTRFA